MPLPRLRVTPGSGFTFSRPDGTPIPNAPPLPGGSVDGLKDSHAADVSYSTIVPPHSGERLNLHEAIWVCLANARARAIRQAPLSVTGETPGGVNPMICP